MYVSQRLKNEKNSIYNIGATVKKQSELELYQVIIIKAN